MTELGVSVSSLTQDMPAKPVARAGSARFAVLAASETSTIAGDWATLANHAIEDNVFFDPDFALPAIHDLTGGGASIALVRSPRGRLIAAASVISTRLGQIAPAKRFWSHQYGPLGTPLIDRDAIEDAVGDLIEGLAPASDRTSLVVPDIPLERPVAQAMARIAAKSGRPVTILGAHRRAILRRPISGSVDLRGELPLRRRKEFSRQMRRLADLGKLAVESLTRPDAVITAFEEFLALEAAGWKGKGGSALASEASTTDLGRRVVANRARHGDCRIDAIRLDGKPIAMVVCFVSGATAYTWKIGYDEAYARFSPGAQLMLEVAANLFSDRRVMRIDSCASANHPMIDHLWKDRMAIGTLVIGPVGGGIVYQAGLLAARSELRARALARRVRNRLQKG